MLGRDDIVAGGEDLPEGQTFHVGAEADDGWMVIALWDSEQSWERFRDQTLMPTIPNVEGGLEGPPEATTFEIHKQQSG